MLVRYPLVVHTDPCTPGSGDGMLLLVALVELIVSVLELSLAKCTFPQGGLKSDP